MLRLLALKAYYQYRLRGTGKMEASLKVAEHIYDKQDYTARLVRRWANSFEHTGKLPTAGHRGKHAKQRSALCDEDVKRKCMQFLRTREQSTPYSHSMRIICILGVFHWPPFSRCIF
ncbi:hypothetical protein V1508DRAFT_423157 [Lipomyces doorenjongii]|uniref:uncharacterized protein n=1 Tax=Lipomyces doorenjongii TaxID=383834 RepID=UPI0034CF6400